jgi:hypothetical protein
LAYLAHLLQDEVRPRQSLDDLHALLLPVFLVGEQPSQILYLFFIILHHNFLKIVEEYFVVTRKLLIAKELLQKLIIHGFLI